MTTALRQQKLRAYEMPEAIRSLEIKSCWIKEKEDFTQKNVVSMGNCCPILLFT